MNRCTGMYATYRRQVWSVSHISIVPLHTYKGSVFCWDVTNVINVLKASSTNQCCFFFVPFPIVEGYYYKKINGENLLLKRTFFLGILVMYRSY